MPKTSMTHLNDNILCAFAIKTTGIRPSFHDLYEVCIYPLDSRIMPGEILPFHMMMQLKREENFERTKDIDYVKVKTAFDPWTVAQFFEEWTEKLKLQFRKRIVPLSKNWAFERGFILDWLGDDAFNLFIDDNQVRDVTRTALYLNDVADFKNEPVPFAKTNFRYLCSTLKIEMAVKNLVWESKCLAEVYRQMAYLR